MPLTLDIVGIISIVFGAFIILFNNIFTRFHQKIYGQPLGKGYWWHGWRPFLKITDPTSGKVTRKIKWKHVRIVYGAIPPKYQLEILSFMLILVGSIFQIVA